MIKFYLLTVLSDIVIAATLIGILATICSIACTLFYFAEAGDDDEEERERTFKFFKVKLAWTVAIISWLVAVFVPTTKQMAFIWIAPQIVENGAVKDTIKNIPELTKLGTDYLKEMLKEKVEK